MDANIAAGIAEGAAQAFNNERDRPFREAQLAEAKRRKKVSETLMAEFERQAPLREQQDNTEMLRLQNEARTLQGEMLFRDTVDAFRAYDSDKNARHLHNFVQRVKKNPIGQRFYGDIARVDDLLDTPEHARLLKEAGYMNPAYFFETDSADRPNLVVATSPEGEQYVVDMDKMYAATGYLDYMQDQELTRMTKRAAAERMLRQGARPSTELERTVENLRAEMPETDEETLYTLARRRLGRGSELERTAAGVSSGVPMPSPDEFEEAKRRTEGRPTSVKETEAIAQLRQQLLDTAGGELTPEVLRDPATRAKVGRVITDLERITGSKLSTEDKRVARDIRELFSLGKTVTDNLTANEAGLIDRPLNMFKKYLTNDVEGVQATSAYEAFRNVYRNALYGATVTGGEARAFEAAIGNLSQQEGPVLQQFSTQLKQLRTSLESIVQMNDPDIAAYYLGTDLDSADNIIRALDERIDMVNRAMGKGKGKASVLEQEAQPKQKRPLTEIFGVAAAPATNDDVPATESRPSLDDIFGAQ